MMDMTVVSIFDVCAGVYSRPVFCQSKGIAMRSFQDECRRVGPDGQLSDMQRHPEDFNLYLLGTFDDSLGKFSPADSGQPVLLLKGSDVKKGNGHV